MYGLHGRFLDIDLGNDKVREIEIPASIYRKFVGGGA